MRLVLFQPEIAQNAGAATRSAACFGARLDIIEPCGFPIGAKAFARVALDYGLLAPPTIHASWRDFTESDARGSGRLILLTTKASQTIWDFDFQPTDLLMVGQESAGVPEDIAAAADVRLRIPIAANARSLNMAMAATVALAEALRQIG